MDFVTSHFGKDEPLTSWTLWQHICPHFWAWLLNTIAITPISEDKYVVKVFNWSEVHLSEMLQNPYFSDYCVLDSGLTISLPECRKPHKNYILNLKFAHHSDQLKKTQQLQYDLGRSKQRISFLDFKIQYAFRFYENDLKYLLWSELETTS